MPNYRLLIFSLFLVFQLPSIAFAQRINPDTSFVQQSVLSSIESYRDKIGMQAQIYTGTEYHVPFKPYIEGHQFFEVKTFEHGSVFYDGAWFHEVPMLYDVAMDEVITIHPGSGLSQKLIKQKLERFIFRGHTYIQLNRDSLEGFSMEPGFYDLLNGGKVQTLVKREKHLQERVSNNGFEGNYDETDKFYLRKDNIYYQVKSKGSVLEVLQDKKKELKLYVRSNKLKFRKNRENAIQSIVQHYNSLI